MPNKVKSKNVSGRGQVHRNLMVPGPEQPHQRQQTVVQKYKGRIQLALTAGSVNVTLANVAGALPANILSYSIQKIHLYGDDVQFTSTTSSGTWLRAVFPTNTVTTAPQFLPWSDGSVYSDFGVFGQSRPNMHIEMSDLTKQLWVTPASTAPLMTVLSDDTVEIAILEVDVLLRTASGGV